MKKIIFLLLFPLGVFAQLDNTSLNIEADSLLTNSARNNNAKYFNRMIKNMIKNQVNGGMITTTGSSGAASFNYSTGVLNIPNYSGGGGSVSTLSHGLTLVGSDGQLGGTLPSGYVADLESTTSGGFIANMLNNSTGGRFQVASTTSWYYQNDGAGFMGLRLDTNNGMVIGDISSGAGTSGIITANKPFSGTTITGTKLSMSAASAPSSTINSGVFWDFTNNELVKSGGLNYDGTTDIYSFTKIFSLTPLATSFSSNQNNYNVGSGTMIDMSTDDTITRQLTGLSNGTDGRLLIIRNMNTTAVIAFNNEDGGSSASNRIHTSTGATLNLNPGKMLMLTYKAGSLNRWVDISF